MGTWDTGPLDNDTALDFLYNLATKPTPGDREALLLAQLSLLCTYNPSHAEPLTDDVESASQIGIAACAVVAMKLAEQSGLYPHIWGHVPDPEDPEDFRVEMLPQVSLPVLHAATGAIAIARALAGHPDMPQWCDEAAAAEHATALEELGHVLCAVAASTPGHPMYVPHTPQDETQGLPTSEAGDSLKSHVAEEKGDPHMPIQRITTRDQLRALARTLGVSGDWHEPDEQNITATVHGVSFDNAGFWPLSEATYGDPDTWTAEGLPAAAAQPTPSYAEMHVTLHQDGEPVAHINLASLLAWAAEPEAPRG